MPGAPSYLSSSDEEDKKEIILSWKPNLALSMLKDHPIHAKEIATIYLNEALDTQDLDYLNGAFYVEQDKTPLEHAIALIALLWASLDIVKREDLVRLIRPDLDKADSSSLLAPYPELAQTIGNNYLADAAKAYTQPFWSKLLTNSDPIPFIAKAVQCHPQILDDVTGNLKEKWITHRFDECIKNKQFDEAHLLFKKHKQTTFHPSSLSSLKEHYEAKIEANKPAILTALKSKKLEEAEALSLEQIELATHIYRITPKDHPLEAQKKQRAQFLLTVDKIRSPSIKEGSLKRLDEAQELISSITTNKGAEEKKILNKILLRKIDILQERIKMPFHNSWEGRRRKKGYVRKML